MLKLRKKKLKMAELIRLMKNLDQEVTKCSRCGICQSVCPLYDVTKQESDVARGKLMLLKGLMRAFFEDPDGVWQRLDRCLLCGACAQNCPRGVNSVEIFLTARMIISGYKRMPLIKKIIFRHLLSNPKFFDRMVAWAARWQYLFFKNADLQIDGSCTAMVSPLLSNRRMIPLATVPFHKTSSELTSTGKSTGKKVAFFTGCLLDKVFPGVATDIVRVLHFHEMSVLIPAAQGCCGIPSLASGDSLAFNRLVEHNLKLFDPSGFDYLVTGCATCTATIKKIWLSMFESPSEEMTAVLHQLAEKTYDISQFLVDVVGVQPSGSLPETAGCPIVTYHDPCHLRKTLNIFSEPRTLVRVNDSYVFTEMPDAASCCGMGGSFNLTHYTLSADIGKKKVRNIETTDASVVATGCPACMIHLSDMLAREKKQIRVAHVVELYAEKILPQEFL